ncbi:TPA: hypothetical protein N0F65_001128 [Lagenidium giganteum]|uniref:Elicitin-like protein n=1 Tax=Lagenidium giganteum TaxID=4803 RepID=A0AAV2YJS4_9STRA|nr:TPA: hypothetical protein N0F65_001128 [Lagenidium giganteum]
MSKPAAWWFWALLLCACVAFGTPLAADTPASSPSATPSVGATPAPSVQCSIDQLNKVNEVLKIINEGFPDKCDLLSVAPTDLVPETFCGDARCKKWAVDTVNLNSCGNPGMDAWQDVVRRNLALCNQVVGTIRPAFSKRVASATAAPSEVPSNNTSLREAPVDDSTAGSSLGSFLRAQLSGSVDGNKKAKSDASRTNASIFASLMTLLVMALTAW